MDKPISVLLIEDDSEECRMIAEYITSTDDVLLVSVTNNANNALDLVKEYWPDVIILDLELHKGCGDGVSFLSALNKMHLSVNPYILITTNNINQVTHEHIRKLGVSFIMVKSQENYSAKTVIEFVRSLKDTILNLRKERMAFDEVEKLSPSEIKKKLEKLVTAEINLIGISQKDIGRKYLIDSILLLLNDQTKNLSTIIGEKYGKTNTSVERAMQNSINRTWKKMPIEILEEHYTAYIADGRGMPTVTEFIYFYYYKIKTKL